MAKKPTDAANGNDDQSDAGAAVAGTPVPPAADSAADAAVAPLPKMPDPIFAQDEEGLDRPMSGGSFIRQADGTLTRNPEA